MITDFTDIIIQHKQAMIKWLSMRPPDDYKALLTLAVRMINKHLRPSLEYPRPDPERIHDITDGDYQGTIVFIIGEVGYQPSTYYYTLVDFGPCSGCDTFEAAADGVDYWTLALSMIQGMRKME